MLKRMKALIYFLCGICMLVCSCNRHSNELQLETLVPIQEYFTPVGMWIEQNDEWADFFKEISGKLFVVNSEDELPDDKLGFSDAYRQADFKNYTMLIYYQLHRWEFDSFKYRFVRQNLERKYNWTITLMVDGDSDPYPEMRCISRFAIMVNKIPEGWDVTAGLGLGDYNWSWEE